MSVPPLYLGVDPGVSGAFALIDDDREIVAYGDLPVLKTAKQRKTTRRKDPLTGKTVQTATRGTKTEPDFVAFGNITANLVDLAERQGRRIAAFVEDVHSMPRDSATASFTFGTSLGSILQALACHGVSVERIKPRAWQGIVLSGIPTGDRDAIAAAYMTKARLMFPRAELPRKKDAGRAAALLLAEACRRLFVETPEIPKSSSESPSN